MEILSAPESLLGGDFQEDWVRGCSGFLLVSSFLNLLRPEYAEKVQDIFSIPGYKTCRIDGKLGIFRANHALKTLNRSLPRIY